MYLVAHAHNLKSMYIICIIFDAAPSELVVRFHTVCIDGVITVPTTKLASSAVHGAVNNHSDQSAEGSSRLSITPRSNSPIRPPHTNGKLGDVDTINHTPSSSSAELHFDDLEDVSDSLTIDGHTIYLSLKLNEDKSGSLLTNSQLSQVVDMEEVENVAPADLCAVEDCPDFSGELVVRSREEGCVIDTIAMNFGAKIRT